MTILDELIKRNIITSEKASAVNKLANEKYGGNIDQALVYSNVDESVILEIKSKIFGIPFRDVDTSTIPLSTLQLIPVETSKIYNLVIIGGDDSVIEVGILNPEDTQSLDVVTFIANKLNKAYKIYLIKTSTYNELIKKYDGLGGEVDQALSELDTEIANTLDDSVLKDKKQQFIDEQNLKKEENIVEDAPIIKIVALILRHAVESTASDIHIENVGEKVQVRFRIDGTLHTELTLPTNVYNGVIARIKILAKMRLDEKRKPQDGGFGAKINSHKIDFRVSSMPAYYGEKIVMRILDSKKGAQPLASLDLSADYLELIREALAKPYGLILITGPTGSGKSTTMYSMLKELDHETHNIVSLEDPIEYQMPGVNQSQVAPEIGYTFASGLRSILRQDPDIIFVGEIRDKETAELAIQAALTGHLVLSTLHTNTAIGAIPRLIDMGIDPYLISPTLILCIAQRLARRIKPENKKEIPMDEATKIMIQKQFADLSEEYKSKLNITDTSFEAVPSSDCPSGLKGRVAVFEMFKIDTELKAAILKSPTEAEIYKVARKNGMITLREDAILKSLKGNITLQETYNF